MLFTQFAMNICLEETVSLNPSSGKIRQMCKDSLSKFTHSVDHRMEVSLVEVFLNVQQVCCCCCYRTFQQT